MRPTLDNETQTAGSSCRFLERARVILPLASTEPIGMYRAASLVLTGRAVPMVAGVLSFVGWRHL